MTLMTSRAPTEAIFDGTASSLYPLGPFRCLAISNRGGAWHLLCPGGSGEPAMVGDRVRLDAAGQLVRVEEKPRG